MMRTFAKYMSHCCAQKYISFRKTCETSFDSSEILVHSVIVISNPKEEGSSEDYTKRPPLEAVVRLCRDRSSWKMKLDHAEKLKHSCQIVKENNGEHVSCDRFETEDPALTKTSEQFKVSDESRLQPFKLNMNTCIRSF